MYELLTIDEEIEEIEQELREVPRDDLIPSMAYLAGAYNDKARIMREQNDLECANRCEEKAKQIYREMISINPNDAVVLNLAQDYL